VPNVCYDADKFFIKNTSDAKGRKTENLSYQNFQIKASIIRIREVGQPNILVLLDQPIIMSCINVVLYYYY
jgi:hypothetical protein